MDMLLNPRACLCSPRTVTERKLLPHVLLEHALAGMRGFSVCCPTQDLCAACCEVSRCKQLCGIFPTHDVPTHEWLHVAAQPCLSITPELRTNFEKQSQVCWDEVPHSALPETQPLSLRLSASRMLAQMDRLYASAATP
jgi:hypothetical protein